MSGDFFSDENIPNSAWFKFDKVGQVVKGTLVETYVKEAEGNFPAQTVYKLTNASAGMSTIVNEKVTDPKLELVWNINVGSSKAFINDRLKSAKAGDIIGLAFIKEIPPKTKGFNPAKSIYPFNGGVDTAYLEGLNNVTIDDANIFE